MNHLRLVKEEPEDDWSHCPKCTGSKTVFQRDAEFEFCCADCLHEWNGNFNFYDFEPEINPDR